MEDDYSLTKLVGMAAITFTTVYLITKYLWPQRKEKEQVIKTTKESTTTLVTTPTTVEVDTALKKDEYRKFELIQVETLTSGALVKCPVKRFRFKLPNDTISLGLPVGQHIKIRANVNGEVITREYTPTSSNDDKGYFELIVKIYPHGKMTQYLDKLNIGDFVEVTGPCGRFIYKKNMFKELGMIAGGTGITPMLQIIREILKHSDDTTKVTLLFGNITEEDIILRDEIDELAVKYPNFHVYHVLNEPPLNWTMGKGFITDAIIKEHMPKPADDMKILLCGPPPMMKAMREHLKNLGYDNKKHVFAF
jgi:cytochrome-b5 reductase